MSQETLIKVENVSKKFCRDLKKSLWYGLKDIAGELNGRGNSNIDLRPGEFWSANDVSFVLKRGECMGLIGPNGAGKSTLLKMLTGLIKPDRGRISIRGRVGALIELGAGFNPILTGRENIYINGAVLGFTKEEIDKKLNSIIEFSELKEFIETPVQNYSSGMKVRLGFSVAAQMEPDVLLVDEVLAVGDVGFRAKCFNTINSLMQRTAVVFVTHDMPQVSRICTDILVLSQGQNVYFGKDIPKGIDHYYSFFGKERESVIGSGKAIVHSISLEANGVKDIDTINYLDNLTVHIKTTIDKTFINPNISIVIVNQQLQNIFQCSSHMNGIKINNIGQLSSISIDLGSINLNPGIYSIELAITAEKRGEILVHCKNSIFFTVKGSHVGYAPVQIKGKWKTEAKTKMP